MTKKFIAIRIRVWHIFITSTVIFLFAGIYLVTHITNEKLAKIIDILLAVLYIIITLAVAIINMYIAYSIFKKYENEETFQKLQKYIHSMDKNVALYIDTSLGKYNANAIKNDCIAISRDWYKYSAKTDDFPWMKATLCHELYHIKQNHPFPEINLDGIKIWNPQKRYTHYRDSWLEELQADRYALDIIGDKKMILAKMEEIFTKKESKMLSTHPPKTIRMKYIDQAIVPTLENVTEEFNKYYKIKKIWEKI